MISQPPAPSHTTNHLMLNGEAVMPNRELLLLEGLRNPSIEWKISHKRDHRSWRSGEETDPCHHSLATSCDVMSPRATSSRGNRLGQMHVGTDWHTTESVTLTARTGEHEVVLNKTAVNSYSHRTRAGIDKSWFTVEFFDPHEDARRLSVDGSKFPVLRDLFEEIASRVQ
jgi:hypothetical protein